MKLYEMYISLKNSKKVIFSTLEFSRIFNLKRAIAWVYLHRMVKKGLIFRVSKGLYSLTDNPIVIASHLTFPSYLSYYTALYFYNLLDEIPNEIFVVTSRRSMDRVIFDTRIRFIRMKKLFGYKKVNYEEYWIFLAEKERLILDLMLKPICPSKFIFKVLESGIDFKKLEKYSKILGVDLSDIKRRVKRNSKV